MTKTDTALLADHLALPVFDAAATLKFYADVLQLPLVEVHSGDDWGGKEWLMMIFGLGDNRQVACIAFDGAAKPANNDLPKDARHFAFAVSAVAALKAWKAKLDGANVDYWEEDHGDQHSIYFSDPNDIIWEITAPPSKSASKTDKAARSRAEKWIVEHVKLPSRERRRAPA
jgi:catechol 2,3-dioxygenase-like lactoylglutathione lyase family enzyme